MFNLVSQYYMFKPYFLVFFIMYTFSSAFGQEGDTTVTYYKYRGNAEILIPSIDSADFVRIVAPGNLGHNGLCTVTEYYVNGNRKFVGTGDDAFMRKYGWKGPVLQGSAINYYPNGKKQNIVNYIDGQLVGMCTEYFPDGSIYCIKEYPKSYYGHIKLIECHDFSGHIIAHEGNGHWIIYQDDFMHEVNAEGEIRDGLMTGEWTGITPDTYAMKFVYTLKRSVVVSAKSFDSEGNTYTFNNEVAGIPYSGSLYALNDFFKRKLKLNHEEYPESNPLKLKFVIEPDKKITHITLEGTMDEKLKEKVANLVISDTKWQPMKYFGKPISTNIEIVLNRYSSYKFPQVISGINLSLSSKYLDLINHNNSAKL